MKASPAYLISQLSNLVLGSACFIAAISATSFFANNAKQAFFGPNLSISPSLYSWTTQVHPQLSEGAIAAGTVSSATPNAGIESSESAAISKEIGQGLQKIAKLEERANHQRRAILNKKHFATTVAHRAHPSIAQASAQATHVVAKALPTAAAVAMVQPEDSVQTTQAAVEVPMTEAEKFQKIHAELTHHFFLAMNGTGQILAEMNTHSVDPAGIQFKSDLDRALDAAQELQAEKKLKKHHAPKRSNPVAQSAPAEEKAATVAAAPQPEPPSDYSETRRHAAVVVAAKTGSSDVFKLGRMATQMDIQSAHAADGAQGIQADQAQASIRMGEAQSFTPPAMPLVLANPSQAPPQEEGQQNLAATSADDESTAHAAGVDNHALTQMANVGRTLWSGYSPTAKQVTTQAAIGHSNAAGAQGTAGYSAKQMATQVAGPTTNTPSIEAAPKAAGAKPAAVLKTSAKTGPVSLNDTVHVSSSVETEAKIQPTFDKGTRWSFAEAFEWNQAVTGAQVEVLSHEGGLDSLGNSRMGWRVARSAQHWGTLFWARAASANANAPATAEEIPLLHANSAKMLAFKAGATLQADAGIVVAKVPAGWSLEFSGRAEHALIFDRANRLLSASSVEEDRYYVFLNASPGEQILYLTRASGETGALAVPVLGSLVAYVDMTQVQKKTISGRVLNVTDSGVRGLSGMRIQVVGSSASAVSGTKGAFKIENVITFGDQALYLETESQKSFPHRYKISANSVDSLSLFNMSEDQVHDWVGQLEGGMSSESGLVVGALPTLAASEEDRKPQVETRSLSLSPTLTPETYTLSSSGQLLVKNPLTASHSRFVSVQVPEGPTLVQALDKDGKVLWSEITVVSPRVLTVVGPY